MALIWKVQLFMYFFLKKNSQKPLRTIFKITLKFITRPVLHHFTVRVRLCYRRRKGQPDLDISSGVIPGAPSVYIPTAKFDFLGFLEDDVYVGGPGGDECMQS